MFPGLPTSIFLSRAISGLFLVLGAAVAGLAAGI